MSDSASAARDRRVIAVIDGNSLMHRAFHAVPPTMNAPDGRPTNAVFGFLNMFLKMVDEFSPDGVVCAFDKGRPEGPHGGAAAVQGAAPLPWTPTCAANSP